MAEIDTDELYQELLVDGKTPWEITAQKLGFSLPHMLPPQIYGHIRKQYEANPQMLNDPKTSSVVDKFGMTMLHRLAQLGIAEVLEHPDVIRVPEVKDSNNKHWSALHCFALSSAASNPSVAQRFLSHPHVAMTRSSPGGSGNYSSETPLHLMAVGCSLAPAIQALIDHPMSSESLDNHRRTPLHYLASRGFAEVMKHPKVADLCDDRKRSPLHCLAEAGQTLVLTHPAASLRLQGGDTPLHVLASRKCLEVLGHPKVATAKNESGETPLHILAKQGVDEVLNHPEVATTYDDSWQTPIFLLANCGHKSVLKSPFVSTAVDGNGTSPLHILAKNGFPEVLEHPAVATVKDKDGMTPLHWLAISGETQGIWALRHPDVNKVKDNMGRTPYRDLADRCHDYRLIALRKKIAEYDASHRVENAEQER